MNSTQRTLAIVAVTVLLAAGFIGFAYAYTTQTDITENTAPSEYFLISSGDDVPTADSYKEQFTSSVKYDTVISYVTDEEASAHQGATHKVVYMLKPDTGVMTGSVYGMELSNLGSVKLNIATQDGAAPLYVDDTGVRVAGTYDIEVLIPADQLDEQLYYFAKAVETGSQTDDHDFAVADTNVDKFVKVTTGPDKGNYVAYLTVPDAESAYTVYIGAAAKGDEPIVKFYENLPTEAELVLDNADITFRVNSESLIASGNSLLIDVSDNSTPEYIAEVVLNHAAVNDPAGQANAAISNVFVATLSYGNGALFIDADDVFKVTNNSSADTKLEYAVASHAIANKDAVTGDEARDLGVNITLTDNRASWIEGVSNNASKSTSYTDNLEITYNIPSIQIATGADPSDYTFDKLVAPKSVLRTVLVPDIVGTVTVTDGDGASFTTQSTDGTQTIQVSVTATKATYTGSFDITVSTLNLKDSVDSAAVLITTGDTTLKASKKILANDDDVQITMMKSLDAQKVKVHKSSAWFVDAAEATESDTPVTVLVMAKQVSNDGTVTWYAFDLPVSVYSLTMQISAVKVGLTGNITWTGESDQLPDDVEYASSNTTIATVAETVVTGVAAGNAVISASFTYDGVDYVVEKTIAVTSN